jgi:hypothetical protein
VPAHRHRDGGKLLALCAEFVHVASGDRGMDGRSPQQTKGLFKVLVAVSLAAVSRLESPCCLLVSQHANNGGAKTRHNGHDGMRDHSDGSGSADGQIRGIRRVYPGRLRDCQSVRSLRIIAGLNGQQAIDMLGPYTGILESSPDGVQLNPQGCHFG